MNDSQHNAAQQADEIEPISETEARAILEAAIRERLGANWQDEHDGWTIIDSHNYMARLNKGRRNIDFYVDLLGAVKIEENELNPAQEYGRALALTFLIGSIFVAIVIARIAGYF